MPISRFQIRSEYGLADPELYRAADRDDPEALLEGVAMAGLVGVLRQLGDLAQFAAEIFHELHEEVMLTSARGHGLMIRVQQLEAEFPSVENAFLSQISHSHLKDNAGNDWHPNLQMDQNVITQGDLPRFIMDSYEECRGPPRLFLLDKFDVAGAGACLKRYSDPSFYKSELSSFQTKRAEVQMEKKSRKIKKKGARRKKEETPEVFSTSQFNLRLHQLASDEIKNIPEKVPTYGARLKRRHLNSASFNIRNGRSYVEHILKLYSCENVAGYEDSIHTSHSNVEPGYMSELGPVIYYIGVEQSPRELKRRERTPVSPFNKQEVSEPTEDVFADNFVMEDHSNSLPDPISEYEKSAGFHPVSKNYDAISASRTELSVDGSRSDDFEITKIPTAFFQSHATDASVDYQSRPNLANGCCMSDEFELDKTVTTSHHASLKDLLVDERIEVEPCADRSRSDELEDKDMPTSLYVVDQKDAVAEYETEEHATFDECKSVQFEVQTISPVSQQLVWKDQLIGGENRIDGNANWYALEYFEEEKKSLNFNDDSTLESGLTGYRSEDLKAKSISSSDFSDKDSTSISAEHMTQVGTDGFMSDDAASDNDNYMDALTTMESEMETDSESRVKHERCLSNAATHHKGLNVNEEHLLISQRSDAHSVEISRSFESNSLFKKERSSFSSDSLSNLACMLSSMDGGSSSIYISEDFQNSCKLKDTFSETQRPCLGPSKRSSSSMSGGDLEIEETSSAKTFPADAQHSCLGRPTWSESISMSPSKDCALIGSSSENSDPCHEDLVPTMLQCSVNSSSIKDQALRSDATEISSSSLHEHNEVIGTFSNDDLLNTIKSCGLQSQMKDVPPKEFSESCLDELLADMTTDLSSESFFSSSDNVGVPLGSKESDMLEVLPTGAATECSPDELRVTETCNPASETTDGSILELAPTMDAVECASHTDNMMLRMVNLPNLVTMCMEKEPCITSEQDPLVAISDGKLLPVSPHANPVDEQGNELLVGVEKSSVILKPAFEFQGVSAFTDDEDIRPTTSDSMLLSEQASCEYPSTRGAANSREAPNPCSLSETFSSENTEGLSNALELKRAESLPESIDPRSFHVIKSSSEAVELPSMLVASSASDDQVTGEDRGDSCDLVSGSILVANSPDDCGPETFGLIEAHGDHLQEVTESASCQSKPEIIELAKHEYHLQLDGEKIHTYVPSKSNEALLESSLDRPESLGYSHSLAAFEEVQTQSYFTSDPVVHVSLRGNTESELQLEEDNQLHSLQSHHCNISPKGVVHPASSKTFVNIEEPVNECSVPPLPKERENLDSDLPFQRKESLEEKQLPEHKKRMATLAACDTILTNGLNTPLSKLLTPIPSKPDHDIHTSELSLNISDSSISSTASIDAPFDPKANRQGLVEADTCGSILPDHCLNSSESPPNFRLPLTSPIMPTFVLHTHEATNLGALEAEACSLHRLDHCERSHELPTTSHPSLSSTSSSVTSSFNLLPYGTNRQESSESQLNGCLALQFPLSSAPLASLAEMPPLPPLEWRKGKIQLGFPTSGEKMLLPGSFPVEPAGPSAPLPTTGDENNMHASSSDGGETMHASNYLPPPTGDTMLSIALDGQKLQALCSSMPPLVVKDENPHVSSTSREYTEQQRENPHVLSTSRENPEQPHENPHVLSTSREDTEQPLNPLLQQQAVEVENPEGKCPVRPNQPRDPLIEAVASHDRNMLRKASERVLPASRPISDNRNSLLEQIKTKSFNLKPANVTRPITQAPKTNLNIVAILEKANAIRQACAGSDEDDSSDIWSDS